MHELAPQELNKFFSEFLITLRKKRRQQGIHDEPNSLRTFFARFERHLKKKKTWTVALSEEDTQDLYEKDLLEHREMCWGDVKLCQTSTGQEYLVFNEIETKSRSGKDPWNVRAIAPKMYAVPNNEECPVKACKVYAEKRPVQMKTEDAPFYLAVNNVKSGFGKPWFKNAPVGVNKLNTLMKTMAQKAGLGPNFKTTAAEKL